MRSDISSSKNKELCEKLIERAGFSCVSVSNFHAPFDIIAEKNGRIVIMKTVNNIDSITPEDGRSLGKLSSFFDAEAYVIGKTYKNTKIEESKVFTRHGISCISTDTVEVMLYNGNFKQARKFFSEKVEINGPELKRLRKLSGMSMRQLSRSSGVSVDSIYRYEHGFTSASPENLEKLESALSSKLGVTYHMGSTPKPNPVSGISIFEINKEPFNKGFKEKNRFEFAELADLRTLKKWSEFYSKFNEVFDDIQFIMTNTELRNNIFGIPTIKKSEIYSISDEQELYDIAAERS
ncbi:MAG: helix-turn-helix domain-containing protein [Methanothrix sp.]